MNSNGTFSRDLERWLDAEAPASGPSGLHNATIERARAMPQHPGWIVSVRGDAFPSRAGAMGRSAVARLAAAAVVGVLVISAALYLLQPVPSTGGRPSPTPPVSADPSVAVRLEQVWTTNQAVALTIQRQDPTDKGRYYWRAITYDEIDMRGWSQTDPKTVSRQAGASIVDDLAGDVVDPGSLHPFTFTVTPVGFRESTIVSPATPTEVQQGSRLTYVGTGGYFATLDRIGATGPYTVTALTQVHGSLTQAELRAAGIDYPMEIQDLYLQRVDGAMGPNAQKLEQTIQDQAASHNPYDLATEAVKELQDPNNFSYTTDVTNLDCAQISTTECFATYKRGFCQYYATTMAVILRDMGVPTRIAEGFLPGAVNPNTGVETIQSSSAHAWVEVYFPGYGWVIFDPTGGNLSQVEPLPSR
jgi:transglutaminase-like putative cysteine protease